MHPRVGYRLNLSTSTDDYPTPALWRQLPVEFDRLIALKNLGIAFHDDFTDFPLAGTQTTQIGHGRYKLYAAAGCSIAPVTAIASTESMGAKLAISMDTDNDEAAIAQSYPTFLLSGDRSTSGPLVFEACYAQNSIATNMAAVFFGLAETDLFTLAANVPMNSADAIDASGSMIGFRIEEDGLGVVDTVRSDRATSFTNIGDTEGGTLAANTFKKFGMVYDPSRSADCITFYVDGIACATELSRTALQAFTNLDANPLGLLWAVAADSAGTSFAGYMKWWRVAQLNPGFKLNNFTS
jgi:hypothetical protein